MHYIRSILSGLVKQSNGTNPWPDYGADETPSKHMNASVSIDRG